jgi:hypothetical protein
MKRITTILLACLSSVALLSCEKNQPVGISQPKQEEDDRPEDQNDNNNNNNDSSNDKTNTLYLTIGGVKKSATLVDNSSTKALVAQLQKGNITYEAHDYGNFEKVGAVGYTFPENNTQITTEPGDLILYQGNNLCIYYDTNSWNFTRVGKLDNMTQAEIKTWVNAGKGNVSVTLSLK